MTKALHAMLARRTLGEQRLRNAERMMESRGSFYKLHAQRLVAGLRFTQRGRLLSSKQAAWISEQGISLQARTHQAGAILR